MGPSYLSRRPLRFTAMAAPATNASDAIRVLTAISTLEQMESAGRIEGAESSSPELHDIRARLDLLVGLVSQLCMREGGGSIPARFDTTIAADQIEWVSPTAMEAGQGLLELFLSDAYPEPLRLAGELTSIPLQESGSSQLLSFRPFALDEDVEDAFRRHVFRHHRREIARKQPRPMAQELPKPG